MPNKPTKVVFNKPSILKESSGFVKEDAGRPSLIDQRRKFNKEVWPNILAEKMGDPNIRRRTLIKKYSELSGIKPRAISMYMEKAGWHDVCEKLDGRMTRDQTQSIVDGLDRLKKKKSQKHLKKMLKQLDVVHEIAEDTANDMIKDKEFGRKNLSSHLSNLSAIQKIGSGVFGEEGEQTSKTAVNLAVLIGIKPELG